MERMSRRQIVTLILVALVVIAVAAVAAVGLNQSTQTANADPEAHTHDGWTATNTLPTTEGSYYLTDDVTISSSWNVPTGTTNLCLNGHGIKMTGNDSVIFIASDSTLNIYDCKNTTHYFDVYSNIKDGRVERYAININETEGNGRESFVGGYITGGKGKDNQMLHGGGVYVNGTFNLYGGNIIGNTVTASNNCGAGVYCNDNSTFRMYGGSISYNYAQNAGCAIFGWHNSTVEIYGGEISYNKTSWSYGSAISFWNPNNNYTDSLKLYGGWIHDNTTENGGGAVILASNGLTVGMKGDPIIRNNTTSSTASNVTLNVYVGSKPINIEGVMTNTEKIGIKLSSGTGTFTKDWSQYMSGKDPADYFVSEADYPICLYKGEAYCGVPPHDHDDVTFTTKWTSTTSLPESAGSYYLADDVTINSAWEVPVGETNLCLNGHVISAASNVCISVITIQNGATLNLYDCDTTTHYYYIDANTYKQNRAPKHDKMYDIGEIAADGPTNSDYVASAKKGTFKGGYITGGTGQGLTSNSRNISGGGFQIYGGGTLNMYGGCVFGNYTSATSDQGNEGGGVYVYQNGVFNMYGGYIIGNQGGNACGGVQNLGTFTMNGGYIGHNTAGDGGWANGGGVGNSGTMTMNGGVIEGNEAGANGGLRGKCGGAIENNGSLTINGGSIINNFCDNLGGGIYMSSASASLTIGANATITGNYNDDITKKADNVYLGQNKMITLGSALTKKNSVGVTLKNGTGVFTSGWSTYMSGKDPNDYFVSDVEGYYFAVNNGEVVIDVPVATVTSGDTTTRYATLAAALNEWEDGTTLTLLADATINTITVTGDVTKTLDLNGYHIENIHIGEGAYITFDGLTEDKKIVIDMDEPGIFTRGWAAKMSGSDPADYFVSKKEGYEISLYAGELRLIDSNSQSGAVTVEWVIRMKSKRSVSDVYGEIVKEKLNENEKIVGVYDVKLIRTTTENGVQTEESVQPSAMGEGRTVVVRMSVPKAYRGKQFRILHIHSATKAEFVDFELKNDDKYAVVTADELSEFAFVVTAQNSGESQQGQGQGGSDPTDPDHQYVPLDPNEPPVINNTNGEGGNPVLHGDTIDVSTDADEVTVEWFYDDDEDEQPDDPNDPIGRGKTYTVVCPDPNDPTHDDSGHTIIAVIKQNKDENGNDYPEDEKPTVVSNLIKVAGHDDPGKDNLVIEDEDKGIEIEIVDVDDENTRNISVEVEVKAEVSQEITQVEDNKLTEQLTENDEIAIVYEVKLIQTTKIDGFEYREEIQPSDIKPGTTVIIRMDVPEELRGKEFRVLHIHTENDVEEVAYTVSADGNYITVRAHRLSEFAFVANNAAGDNNGQGGNGGESGNGESGNENSNNNGGNNSGNDNVGAVSEKKEFCPGWISIIFGFIVLAYFIVIVILVSKRFKALRRLLSMIGLGASWAITLAALIIVAVHTCAVSTLGFGLCVLDILLFIIYEVDSGRKCKKCIECTPDDGPAEVAATEEGTEDAPVEAVAVAPVEVESEVIDAESVAEEPVTEEPVAEEPAPEEPATEEPVAEEPAPEEPVAEETVAEESVEEEPVAEEPAPEEPVAEEPVAEEPAPEEPVAEETVAEESVAEEPASEEPAEEEISLRESLSLATTVEAPASETVSKDFIGESLTKKYGDGVKVNRRGNLTRTGLPLADTHYVIRPDGKECFVYVYETNGTVMILAQLADKEAKELRKKHKNVNKSAFPKSKKKWYSIVVDDSFTAEDVEALLETSYNHVK